MMARRIGVWVWAIAFVVSVPAWAQTTGAPAAKSTIGGRLFGHVDLQSMAATDTFNAVTNKSSVSGGGAGGDVNGLWRGMFVRVSVTRLRASGERVYVSDGVVFPLGIPLALTMTPIEVAAGWRFKPLGSSRIVPYLGGGAAMVTYSEASDADASGEAVHERYTGVTIFGGIDVPVWRSVSAGAEVGWRTIAVTDPGGAMGAFGEKDLGGVTMRLMLSVGK